MAARDFLLPDLGEGLEEAELVSWKVAEGDTVALNQPLAEVETAKALVEIPSPFAGTIAKLHAGEGEVVKVGAPLVTFEVDAPADDGGNGSTPPRRQAVLVGYGPAPDEEPSATVTAAGGRDGAAGPTDKERAAKVKATPVVRKLAKELGVDLASVTASGPGGRITREDVEAAASQAGATASADRTPVTGRGDERVPVRGVRKAVAEHMTASWREIPQVTTFLTADFTHVLTYRDELRAARPDAKVSVLAIVARALGEVVREHRAVNASWAGEEIVLRSEFHLGVATDTEHGLMVPVVRDADRMGIGDLAVAIAEAAEAARTRKAAPEQLTGSTITISNVGSFGAEYGTPIINPPEAAILALGLVKPTPVVVDGEIEARPAAVLSLTFDHRVLDGAQAGRALRALADLVESPFSLGALPR